MSGSCTSSLSSRSLVHCLRWLIALNTSPAPAVPSFMKSRGAKTICLSGKGGGKARDVADLCIVAPGDKMVQIEDVHLAMEHAVADELKKEIDLGKIENVEIGTQTEEAMARSFLKLAPVLMDDLETAFGRTIRLLRIPQKEENGHDMLATSLETLHALKSHLENVWNVLGRPDKLAESSLLWEKFDNLADMIVINQERKNAMNIASLLEERVPAFLGEWKKTIEVKEDRSNLGPALQVMKSKPVEELAARA